MDIVVRTQQGAVRGTIIEGIAVFKGIPYAASPFGARRFQPPQPVEVWNGVRDALTSGATVTKPPYFPPFDVLYTSTKRCELRSSVSGWLTIGTIQRSEQCPEREKR